MKKNIIVGGIIIVIVGLAGLFFYPKMFPSRLERKILYWTDSMIPGDRSDHPGKSPMGMERTPVYADETQPATTSSKKSEEKSYYTCPMHPSVRSDHPGACPVCGMNLVKQTAESELSMAEKRTLGQVTLSPTKQLLANVSTSIVIRKSLEKEIHAAGNITYAEPNLRQITARFSGRIEKLYIFAEGEKITKSQPVAEIYSPDAISAQNEYLLAKASGVAGQASEARQKLVLWGFTDSQIDELDKTGKVKSTVTIFSPISGIVLKKNIQQQQYITAGENLFDIADLSAVWLNADIYENEIQWVRTGQTIDATTDAYPGEHFTGKITFISSTIDPSARTIRIRADLPNGDNLLRQNMFVQATIRVKLPEFIVVPSSAVFVSGVKDYVWIQKDAGIFEPRIVTVGGRDGEFTQILEGLEDGDTVVTSGGYLLDSESQLQSTNSNSIGQSDTEMK
jgi:membrane fusion protein, copper/silver efflux system